MRRATSSDIITATATVMPNSRKYFPAMPGIALTGKKTTTIANVVATTAKPMRSAAINAARHGVMPGVVASPR